jgi:hypothetical protein
MEMVMKKGVIFVCLPVLLSACASAGPDFVGAAESHGLNKVAMGEMVYTGCGNDRAFARKFTAEDASGTKVDGVVCSGLLGPTVMAAPAGQRLARLAPGQALKLAAGY